MEEKIILEEECSECGGTGEWHGGRCPECHGRRVVPTEEGRYFLEFVRRHLVLE